MSNIKQAIGNYAIERVGRHSYRVIHTDKTKQFRIVSALYDGTDAKKLCWDWIVHNVDEAIHYAPFWYINATHDVLGR